MLSELESGCDKLGLHLNEKQLQSLLLYLETLDKWNKAYNLTGLPTQKRLAEFILDSLAVVPFIQELAILDVGTGAGVPGIPLAIAMPEAKLTLLDSNGKKTRFLLQAKQVLSLDNVEVVNGRVEQFQVDEPFGAITSKAFASLEDFLTITAHLRDSSTTSYALKGSQVAAEITPEIAASFVLNQHELDVPGVDAKRYLLCCKSL